MIIGEKTKKYRNIGLFHIILLLLVPLGFLSCPEPMPSGSVTFTYVGASAINTAIPKDDWITPRAMAVSPDGSTAYILTKNGDVIPYNTTTYMAGGDLGLGNVCGLFIDAISNTLHVITYTGVGSLGYNGLMDHTFNADTATPGLNYPADAFQTPLTNGVSILHFSADGSNGVYWADQMSQVVGYATFTAGAWQNVIKRTTEEIVSLYPAYDKGLEGMTTGIAYDSTNNQVLVSLAFKDDVRQGGEMLVFSPATLRFRNKFGGQWMIDSPNGISVDSNGYAFVADRFGKRIRVFNSTGYFATSAGNYDASLENGGINQPINLTVRGNDIYVIEEVTQKLIHYTYAIN